MDKASLVGRDSGICICANGQSSFRTMATQKRLRFIAVFLAIYGIAVSIKLCLITSRPRSIYSPFSSSLRYVTETSGSDSWSSQQYIGEPNKQSEIAWNQLIRPNRRLEVRLYRDEAQRLGINESIHLTDGNYAVVFAVHHNLHCLRRLRQSLWADYYYPDMGKEERAYNHHHDLHCLESIRSSMVCQPDVTPYPYYWSRNIWHWINARPVARRECVDWGHFSEHLSSERGYDLAELVKEGEEKDS